MGKNRKMYTEKEMEKFKTDIVEYNLFKNMEQVQQAELLLRYEEQFSTKELAELWGIKINTIYNLKYALKKLELIDDKEDKRKKQHQKTNIKTKTAEVQEEIKAKQEEIKTVPSEYLEQTIIHEPTHTIVRHSDDVNVSLDSFMKILEIQEKMAKMIEEQSRQKKRDGFYFDFKGEFTSEELKKRLNKILTVIDDEPYRYKVRFELIELEKEENLGLKNEEETQNDLLEEMTSLKENMEALKKQIEVQKNEEQQQTIKWINGYNALKSDKDGLHEPVSEYEKSEDFTGKVLKKGKVLYQAFYICPDCGHKGKHFIEAGSVYCNCKECGKRMRVREAVKDQHLTKDTFGNYFVAGKFKREEELNRDKPLFEVWNEAK